MPCMAFLDRLEMLLAEKLSLVDKFGAATKGFAATQIRIDAYRQVNESLKMISKMTGAIPAVTIINSYYCD